MACLGCHCGNRLSNTCDGDETQYYFMPKTMLKEHWEDMAFFEIQYSDLTTEMWKCDMCDRMMVFDNDTGYVSKFMKQVEAEGVPREELVKPHIDGLCYNNLLFNDVDRHFTFQCEHDGIPDYVFFQRREGDEDNPLLSPKVMFEEVFSCKNGRFRNWWYASMYEEYLILYSIYRDEWDKPVRAWKCYKHTVFGEDGKPIKQEGSNE